MQVTQLELNLWSSLEIAAAQPLAANMDDLWQELSGAIAPLPLQLKLQTVAEAILQIAQIYGKRASLLLDDLLDADSSDGPVLDADMLGGMLRQTMTLDLDALLEPSPYYPRDSNTDSTSIATEIDSNAILEVLDELAVSQSNAEDPTQVAHTENVSAWSATISDWMQQRSCGEAVSLLLLQQALGMPLMDIWLGLLLSPVHQYDWETKGDFYSDAKEILLKQRQC